MQKVKIPRYLQWTGLTALIFLLVMSLLRLAFIFSFRHTETFGSLWPAIITGIRYDARMVAIPALLILLLALVPALHPYQKKRGRWLAMTIWTLFSVMLCLFYAVDFAHYAYIQQRLNGNVLNYLEDAKISARMMWQSYPVLRILLGLLIGVITLVWLVKLLYNSLLYRKIVTTRIGRIAWSVIFFILFGLAIFGRAGQYPLRWSDAFSLGSDYKAQVALNPIQSFFSTLTYRHSTYDIKKVKQYYPWMAAQLGIPQPDTAKLNYNRPFAVGDSSVKPNIVLVICESFSSYKSSMINNPLNTTPYFNSLVQQGIYFDNCFSPCYGTARGVWATITGVPDVQLTGTASRNPAAVDQHTIINDFKGYEKYYFIGGSTSWANIRGLLTNNIDGLHIYEQDDFKGPKIDVWGVSDKNLFLETADILDQKTGPFFAVIQTADNHRPYTIPAEDEKVLKRIELPADTLHKYGFDNNNEYNAFRYTDYCFQQFMEKVKTKKYYNNTLFVFVGDHGIIGSSGTMLPQTFTTMTLNQEHIPLLFYAPSLIKPARYGFPASQPDIMPTIASLARISYTNTALGTNLLDSNFNNRRKTFIYDVDLKRIGIIQDDKYYYCNIDGSGERIGSTINDNAIMLTDSLRNSYKNATYAYYETARYLLLNNKKPAHPAARPVPPGGRAQVR